MLSILGAMKQAERIPSLKNLLKSYITYIFTYVIYVAYWHA